MCGLAGIIDFDAPVEPGRAAAMARALEHRGPDDDGLHAGDGVALAFRRLAIIDLSPGGHQPMTDGRYWLLHNGELYNYLELRVELEGLGHRFSSQSDTEVVLAAYREWGERCVERFIGMWAIAIWDPQERRLFCSRDRFGIKPFFYRLSGRRLEFASELKAFRALPEPLRPNVDVIRQYLALGLVDHREETFLAGIRRLPAAHNLVFDRDGLKISRYWALELREPPDGDPAEAVRELFLDSIRLHLRSDVPVGTALSGGLDSSAIVCSVAELAGPGQKTISLWFDHPGANERRFAEAAVERAGARPHWLTFTGDELVADLPRIVLALDEPFAGTANCAHWYVMRAAREAGLTVMLDGQGSDEIFAGYATYFRSRYADILASGRLLELSRELRAYRSLYGVPRSHVASVVVSPFFPRSLTSRLRARISNAGALLHDDLRPVPAEANGNGSVFPDRLRKRLERLLLTDHLPEMVRYEDRNSMAHSIEARVPFLDHRLVEYVFSLEGGELIDRGYTKSVLRRALADLLPPAVRERHDKMGFPTPQGTWWKGSLGAFAAEVFGSAEFEQRGFVAAAAARAGLEAQRSAPPGRGYEGSKGRELWRALSLELWSRAFLDRTA